VEAEAVRSIWSVDEFNEISPLHALVLDRQRQNDESSTHDVVCELLENCPAFFLSQRSHLGRCGGGGRERGREDGSEGEQRKSRPLAFMYSRFPCRDRGRVEGANFKPKLNSHDRFQLIKQMIPSFTSFPSRPLEQDLEASTPSSEQKSSKKDRKSNKKRTRNGDEPEKREDKHKHKDKERDRDRDLKEGDRREASSSSTTFFSDYKGNRSAAYGGGKDSIQVPKYNLVARRLLQNLSKYN
jgi:hypothetical protein